MLGSRPESLMRLFCAKATGAQPYFGGGSNVGIFLRVSLEPVFDFSEELLNRSGALLLFLDFVANLVV